MQLVSPWNLLSLKNQLIRLVYFIFFSWRKTNDNTNIETSEMSKLVLSPQYVKEVTCKLYEVIQFISQIEPIRFANFCKNKIVRIKLKLPLLLKLCTDLNKSDCLGKRAQMECHFH